MIKAPILDQLLTDWFTKSLLPPISRDLSMGGVITEDQAISRAQYLDLVYSQSGTLYDLIPHAPHPTSDPSRPSTEPPADGILGFVQTQLKRKSLKKKKQSVISVSQTASNPKNASPPVVSTEVNTVQSSKSSRGKNKKQEI